MEAPRCASPKPLWGRLSSGRQAKGAAVQEQLTDPVSEFVVNAQSRAVALRKVLNVNDRVENGGKHLAYVLSCLLEHEAVIASIKLIRVVTPHIQCMRMSGECRMPQAGFCLRRLRVSL